MKYWLMKSEPKDYSIDNLKKDGTEPWTGVRNFQVRNMMKNEMKVGDRALFYHSNAGKDTGVAGSMTIVKIAQPDPTQFDHTSRYFDKRSSQNKPLWWCVDVRFEKKFARIILLSELKKISVLSNSPLLKKGNRLSIVHLSKSQFEIVLKLE